MKKRTFKQFVKEDVGFWIWVVLISFTMVCAAEDISIWIKLSLVAICVLYAIVGLKISSKEMDKEEKQKAENKNKRLQELKIQYKYYVDLVDRHVKETLNKFKTSLNVDIDTSIEYLFSFSDKVDWICENRIVGKPDSFIIATCLMYSLMDHPVIMVNEPEGIEYLYNIQFSINMDVAMSCVFEIISEPSTYFEDNGTWVEEKHPKVNISVPKGIIKDCELSENIFRDIWRDELAHKRASVMQFSNLLHLIYLNCQ